MGRTGKVIARWSRWGVRRRVLAGLALAVVATGCVVPGTPGDGAEPTSTTTSTTAPDGTTTSAPTPTSTSTTLPETTTTSAPSTTTTSTTTPPRVEPSPAVAYHNGVTHDGFANDDRLGPPLALKWELELGGPISYPLIAEGKVFVTATTDQWNSALGTTLYAFDQTTGETVWSRKISINKGTTAAYDAGRIFAVDREGLTQSYDAATGDLLWSVSLKTPSMYIFRTPPTASDGMVYTAGAGTGDPAGVLYALRASDGSIAWSQPVRNGGGSAPALSANSVFVSYSCGHVYAFDRSTGEQRWHNDPPCYGGGGSNPVYHGGKVYVRDGYSGASDGYSGNMVIDAETGVIEGSFDSTLIPAFADGIGLFLVGDVAFDGVTPELRAVRDGQILWTFTAQGELRTAPVVAGSTVFVAGQTGIVYALDLHTGELLWSDIVAPEDPVMVWPPNEGSLFHPLTGLGAGDGLLVVPAFDHLAVYGRP
jgi:outer membrane protein assembly factor BamB